MNRTYDIFEKMPNGDLLWRGCVADLEAGREQVMALAERTGNECLLTHILTQQVMERVGSRATGAVSLDNDSGQYDENAFPGLPNGNYGHRNENGGASNTG